jgi:zinc protease
LYSDARIAQPYVVRTYVAPERNAGDQEDAAALRLFAELLGGSGTTSYLAEKLQFDEQKAIYTSAFYGGMSLDRATFGLVIVPSDGVSLSEAETALDAAVAQFLVDGVDMDDLNRIKMQIRASEIYAQDNTRSLANLYGEALTSGLTVEDVQAWPSILDAVAPEAILDAARRVLNRDQAVTGWVMTKGSEEVMQ